MKRIVVTDKIELTLKRKEALMLIEILSLVTDDDGSMPDEHFDFGNELMGMLQEAVEQLSKKN